MTLLGCSGVHELDRDLLEGFGGPAQP